MAAILESEATINQHLAYITPRSNKVSTTFLRLFLTGAYSQLRAISDGSGSTKGALTCEDLKQFRITLPGRGEQDALVAHIAEESAYIDKAINRARREVDLIREYRTRLVSDIVTGKLDVRGVDLPEMDEPETPREVLDPLNAEELTEAEEVPVADF
jgi:type I restriction enzyme S subunit